MYRYFQVMSNELSSPKILVCPFDKERKAAPNFGPSFTSSNLGYFIGLYADEKFEQSILAGDRRLTLKGGAVRRGPLAIKPTDAVGWDNRIHGRVGNVAMADGSVQTWTSLELRRTIKGLGTNVAELVVP